MSLNKSEMTYVGATGNVSFIMDNLTQTIVDVIPNGPGAPALTTATPFLAAVTTAFDFMAENVSGAINCGNISDYCNATEGTPLRLLPDRSLVYQIVCFICWGLVLICGIVGNTMVVLVVCRISHMRTPTNCYLVSLATADTLVLITGCLPATTGLFAPTGWVFGDAGCKLSVYLQYVAINVSSLSISAFTIERYIAICHPMKAQTICTVSRAKRIIGVLWTFAVLYCMPWLFLVGTQVAGLQSNGVIRTDCLYKQQRDSNIYNIMYFVDLCAFYVTPSILSVVVYGLIAKILFSNTVPQNDTKDSFRHKHKLNGVTKRESRKKNQSSSSRRQVIKMLIVVVVLFLSLWAPYRVLVVYNSLVSQEKNFNNQWYFAFSSWCIFFNSAINPILYNFMSVKFRRAFVRLCGCGKHRKLRSSFRSSTMTTEKTSL